MLGGMYCSQNRSQPAGFSGRTAQEASSRPLRELNAREAGQLRQAIRLARRKAAQARPTAKEEAEALSRTAAGLRRRIHSFDYQEPLDEGEEWGENGGAGQEGVATSQRATPFTQAGQFTAYQEPRPLAISDLDLVAASLDSSQTDAIIRRNVFDWAMQIVEVEEVSAVQLLQLVGGMGHAIGVADAEEAEALRRHEALPAAGRALRLLYFQEVSDESLVMLAVAFGAVEDPASNFSSLDFLCGKLRARQAERPLQIQGVAALQMFGVLARAPQLSEAVHEVTVACLRELDMDSLQAASPDQLLAFLACVSKARQWQTVAEKARTAFANLVTVRERLLPNQLAQLLTLAYPFQGQFQPRDAEVVAALLVEKDRDLHSVPDFRALLYSCARMSMHNLAFAHSAAAALARRIGTMGEEEGLKALHSLSLLEADLPVPIRRDLAAALEGFLHPPGPDTDFGSEEFLRLVRSLWKLHITPSWREAACLGIVDEIQRAAQEMVEASSQSAAAMSHIARLALCLAHLKPPLDVREKISTALEAAVAHAGDLQEVTAFARLAAAAQLPHDTWAAIGDRALAFRDDFNTEVVRQLLYCFAKARIRPEVPLLTAVHDYVEAEAGSLTLHHTSLLLWSYAMLRLRDRAAYAATAALVARVVEVLEAKDYQEGRSLTRDLANVAWAVATLEHASCPLKELLALVQKRARPIQEMGGPSLSIMLWACAKARLRSVYMLPLYSERIEQVVGQLQPLQVTTILWAYAQLKQHPGIELMEALLAPLTLNIGQADPEGIANAVWACGELRHHPGPLVRATLADLRRRGKEFSLKDWSLLLWGFTSVGEDTGDMLHMLDARIRATDAKHPEHPANNLKLLSNAVWSAAVFEHLQTPLYPKLMQLLPQIQDRDPHCKRRIQEAHLLACLSGVSQPQDLHPTFRMRGQMHHWRAELMVQDSGPRTAGQVRRIRYALRRMNLEVVSNHVLVPSWMMHSSRLLQLDLLLIDPLGYTCKLAVELLSPSMVTRNTHQPCWRSLYRAACLNAMGFEVLYLPFSEWEEAQARDLEEEYLASKIHALLSD